MDGFSVPILLTHHYGNALVYAVYARKQFDLSYRDLGAAAAFGLCPGWDRERLEADLQALWSGQGDALTALSVRTAFDAWLATLALPRGSEIIASGINIPDMARILEHHGLKIVPVDVNLRTMEISGDDIAAAITSRTRLVMVAHLFGTRMDMNPVFEATAEHPNIQVVEDCAQAFAGLDEYRGDDRSDISLFSFGSIKTATALGGALCRIRCANQRAAVRERLAGYPAKSGFGYTRKAIKYMALKTLGLRWVYGAFVKACSVFGVDFDQLTVAAVRGFKGDELIPLLRHQPPAAQLALLRRRLQNYRRANLDGRCQAGSHLNQNLPAPLRSAGYANPHHTWWLFPVSVEDPATLVTELRAAGFDATASSTQLCALQGITGPAPASARFMDGTVYLPLYASMRISDLERMAGIVRQHGEVMETESVEEESELAAVPLGK